MKWLGDSGQKTKSNFKHKSEIESQKDTSPGQRCHPGLFSDGVTLERWHLPPLFPSAEAPGAFPSGSMGKELACSAEAPGGSDASFRALLKQPFLRSCPCVSSLSYQSILTSPS